MRVLFQTACFTGLVVLMAVVAVADQQAYISQDDAQRAAALLEGVNEIQHFCAPCGDSEPTPEVVNAIEVAATGYENYYEVKINGKGIDLAYTYTLIDGNWTNMAMHLGLEVVDVPRTLGESASTVPADAGNPGPRDFGSVYFAGTLGDKLSIYMELVKIGETLEGVYHYAHVGDPIMISGEIDDENNISLAEMVEGETTGRFVGKFDRAAGEITGQWMTPDGSKTMPFVVTRFAYQLRESRAVRLSPAIFGDSMEGIWHPDLVEGEAAMVPQITVSAILPYFVPEEDETTLAINAHVRNAFDGFAADSTNDFASGAASFMADPEDEFPHWLQYSCDSGIGRFYCYNGDLVSFTLGSYIYTGGAHGMYWTDPVNLGLVDGDAVPLEFDKLFTDTDAAVGIVSAYCIEDLKRQEASSVTSGAITEFSKDDLASFALSKAGMTIFFPPYAVASYAEGAFEVTVPWDDLTALANKSLLGTILPE